MAMTTRRTSLTLLAALAAFAALPAAAAGFDRAAFDRDKADGRTVVVEVHADWCPVCRVQQPILAELAKDPAFAEARFVVVDFDTEKDFLRDLGVQQQSTLVVFKGAEETGRATGLTDPAQIRELLATGL